MVIHMRGKNFLSTGQYGSINRRYTTKKLSSYIDNCIDSTVAEGVLDTIYLDLVKTFDSIPHYRCLGKFKWSCVSGNILIWNKVFLNDCCQTVEVNRVKSYPGTVLSRIP